MSSAVLRNCIKVASSHASAGTVSMASAIAPGLGAERINLAAIAIWSFNSFVTTVVATVRDVADRLLQPSWYRSERDREVAG